MGRAGDGKRITTRTPLTGQVGHVFQAVGIALPPNTRDYLASLPIPTM